MSSNASVRHYLAQGNIGEAIKHFNTRPDVRTATLLISNCWKERKDISLALSIYNTLKESPHAHPDSFIYTTLVRGCRALNTNHLIAFLWKDAQQFRVKPDTQLYSSFLSGCLEAKDFQTAKSIIEHLDKSHLNIDSILCTILMKVHTAMGEGQKAIAQWHKLKTDPVLDAMALSAALSACALSQDLSTGKEIHGVLLKRKLFSNCPEQKKYLDAALINMYAKCKSIVEAKAIFDAASIKDVVIWTAMMSVYNHCNQFDQTIALFQQMKKTPGVRPNAATYSCLFVACINSKNTDLKEKYYTELSRSSEGRDILASTTVQQAMVQAERSPQISSGSVSTGVSLRNREMSECNSQNQYTKAISVFQRMEMDGVIPDATSYIHFFTACFNCANIDLARCYYSHLSSRLHNKAMEDAQIVYAGLLMKNKLYCESEKVLKDIQSKSPNNIASKNYLIRIYQQTNQFQQALALASQLNPSEMTAHSFVSLFNGCANIKNANIASAIYANFCASNHTNNAHAISAGISMFSKCGSLEGAKKIYCMHKNSLKLPSFYNSMMSAYAQNSKHQEALEVYKDMEKIGCPPTAHTFAILFGIGAELQDPQLATKLLNNFDVSGVAHNMFTLTSLISMVGKCLKITQAEQIFQAHICDSCFQQVPLINAMLSVYAANDQLQHALGLFHQIQDFGIKADGRTLAIMLGVAGEATNISLGQIIHSNLLVQYDSESKFPIQLSNALISMYSKCGSLSDSWKIFDKCVSAGNHDIVTWTAMIQALGIHGCGKEALELFNKMHTYQIVPSSTILTCLLNACSHAGLVEQAFDIYSSMECKYSIIPDGFHNACMIDAWGRAGELDKAETFISTLMNPSVIVWKTLLGASHNYNDLERAQRAFAHIMKLEPQDPAAYVLLANTYEAAKNKEEHLRLWNDMAKQGINKVPGMTWVTINDKTEVFYADVDHKHKAKLQEFLTNTRYQITIKFKYKPNIACVFQPELSNSEKLERLWMHSEKLAIAWALITVPHHKDIVLHKNLRICKDCHETIKMMTKLYERKFVIRDANRFHHFENGKCSCNDYW